VPLERTKRLAVILLKFLFHLEGDKIKTKFLTPKPNAVFGRLTVDRSKDKQARGDKRVTYDEFSTRIIAMMQTLYRVSYTQLAQSCDRDEAVQECLYKAWQKRHQLKDERCMKTWVIRILINECHNIQRKRSRELPLGELPERVAPADADAELHDALFSLEEKLRLPILLHYIEGFSIKEVAQILRLPQGTVKSRMLRGRQKLKKILREEGQLPCETCET